MTRDDAIRKITACLAIANDAAATEQEAATALRHAQVLMDEHGITDNGIAAAAATEHQSRRQLPRDREPAWSSALSQLVCKAFGVYVIRIQGHSSSRCSFIGIDPAPEIACYTWDVLHRQLKRSRTQYIATLPKRLKRATKTRRGDLFAQAWVSGVARTVNAFAGTDQSKAIAAYKDEHYPAVITKKVKCAAAKNHDLGASFAGRRAASGVRLDRPVGADAGPQRLEQDT